MPLPDVEHDARVRVAGLEAHEQDVARLDAVDVLRGEEARAGAGRVERGDLVGGDLFDRVAADFGG